MVYKSNYVFWAKIFSLLISPYFRFLNLFRKKYDLRFIKVKTILVTEYHRIGDVIIIAPILRSIKSKFPDAEIILICNDSVKKLAEKFKLADKVFGVSAPWTNWSWSVFEWYKIKNFANALSLLNIDLAIDFKGDLRNSWFLWSANPKISYGYNTTGGDYFITNSFTMNQEDHQYSRAWKLIKQFGCELIKNKEIRYRSAKNGCIVLHPGSSDSARSWPDYHWKELAKLLTKHFKVSFVITKESHNIFQILKSERLEIEYFEGSLTSFCDYIKNQKCLIAVDSMAGHLGSFLGVPVVSLFGSQNPELTKPYNKFGKIIKPEEPCKHKRDHWRLCKLCLASISPEKVNGEICQHILHIESKL
tara:strand:- start:527 stop:1609 length:1083 start_codon:yes stop_codon:yes gene_type:complete